MSRIGKQPIKVPEGVTVSETAKTITVKGPKGELFVELPRTISYAYSDQVITLSRKDDEV